MILVDAGPLVALIHEDDEHHKVCKEAFATPYWAFVEKVKSELGIKAAYP